VLTMVRPSSSNRVEVPDGEKAILRATAMILMHGRLHPGDRLTVEAAD